MIFRSLQHRLGLAIALPTLAAVAVAAGGVVLTRDIAYQLGRADKALAQAAALEALRSAVETTLLATLVEADTDAARRAQREFERDAMHLLGILDQRTEDEIVFVEADERADEVLERTRPAALREAVSEVLTAAQGVVRLRLAAEVAMDANDRFHAVIDAHAALVDQVSAAVDDERAEVATARAALAADLTRLRVLICAGAGLAALVALALAWPLVSGLGPRLRKLATALDRIAAGFPDAPLADRTGDELGEVADRVDAVARSIDRQLASALEAETALTLRLERQRSALELGNARLREIDATRRRLTGDIGHALKTPLAVARGTVENTRTRLAHVPEAAPMLARALAALDAVSDRVSSLVDLARADDGRLDPAPQQVELFEVLDRRIAALRILPGGEHLTLGSDAEGPLLLLADPRDLDQMLDAVLENALEHAGADGPIRVRTSRSDNWAELRVADSGPGIPAAEIDRIFRRHHSGRPGGTGIGLAMARQIAEDMGGTITLASLPGKGLEVLIRLPLADDAAGRTGPCAS